jgi:hypothetical protein
MTLDVWIKEETESLRRFRVLREREPKADPDMYSEQIKPRGWGEKYHAHEETIPGHDLSLWASISPAINSPFLCRWHLKLASENTHPKR